MSQDADEDPEDDEYESDYESDGWEELTRKLLKAVATQIIIKREILFR